MPQLTVPLRSIAHGRSGDKGSHANVGIIALSPELYRFLEETLSEEAVAEYFAELKPQGVERYTLPKLGALNFLLKGILRGGGSRSLRLDAQGKALAQALLEMPVALPPELAETLIKEEPKHSESSHG